ncbi:MAG TPA: SDR family oxidoreductase [Brevundimonas sp.]|jgi:uncharacterized protein YbjT (DUF2867 family)|uniref:SDR family oxidoreductase n=1 Tax=Brevundimonas sp. TaxID=1871086 RepID=UPI002DE83555|nr:SDR family oxidoreductase [Brevundimonas sp.]
MQRRVLILGAGGFIGAQVAAAFDRAGWRVRASARRPAASSLRAPGFEWVALDFADPGAEWAGALAGVDAVINCVGALQDGADDSLTAAHVDGPGRMIAAMHAAGVRRLVHVSAVGADDAADTDYARTKVETERMVVASGLQWVILRPSLVIGRGAFGGTGLIRALAAFPLVIPVVGGQQVFRPIFVEELAQAIVAATDAPAGLTADLGGPQAVTQAELLRKLRAWLGLRPAPVWRVPLTLARPALAVGDVLGRLGWASPLRTTSLAQMAHDVAGRDAPWPAAFGAPPRGLDAVLRQNPASVQDVHHARLWFLRPVAIVTLSLFWIASGLITFGPGWQASVATLQAGGFGALSPAIAGGGAVVDVLLGVAVLKRSWTSRAAVGMALVSIGYLIAGTLSLPHLWLDPLGPWLKVLPGVMLALYVAATEARR